MTDDDQWWSWPWSRWLWCTKRGWRRGWLRFSSFFNIWSHGINAVGQASSPTTAPSTPPKFEGRWTFSETVWNRTSILVWCIFRPEDIFACLIVFFKNSSYFTCGQDHWPRSQLWEWSGLQKTQRLVVENGKRRGVKMSKETGFKRKTRRLKRKTRKTLEAPHLLFSFVCTCAFSRFPQPHFFRFNRGTQPTMSWWTRS